MLQDRAEKLILRYNAKTQSVGTDWVFSPSKTKQVFQMCDYIVVHSVRVRTEFTPEVFGRLTTLGPVFMLPGDNTVKKRRTRQVCDCSCGNILVVQRSHLESGATTSCGCARIDAQLRTHTKHGKCRTPEYGIWTGMRQRCGNPNREAYPRYGDRGIKVCARWECFENFLADMGPRPSPKHSIERKENNGNYEPSNCQWEDRITQANNQRNNLMITIDQKTDTMANWCRHYGIRYHLVAVRITKLKWDAVRALTTPPGRQGRKYAD